MSVFTGTSVKGDQFLGSIPPTVAGSLRLIFPALLTPPSQRAGYYYVYAIKTSAPQAAYLVDSGLLLTPGIAANYGTTILAAGFSMQVRATWNQPGYSWQLTIT